MKNTFYIQPLIPSYRAELVARLAENFELTVVCGQPPQGSGFSEALSNGITALNCPHVSLLGGRLLWQRGVMAALWGRRPDLILACANPRDITFWVLLLWGVWRDVPVYSHGQGLYSKRKVTWPWRMMYRCMLLFTERYIAYTPLSRDSLLAIGVSPEKVVVADNSIRVAADAKLLTKTGTESGVLFVGRLREKCNLENLVDAVARLRIKDPEAVLHIVGSGELEVKYREQFNQSWVIFHGAVYDDYRILNISRDCRVGCYPGNAGLSVVHYFALRLPPLVHSDMPAHMGPEPSYVQDGVNGMLFSPEQKSDGISVALEKIWEMPITEYQTLSSTAFAEYERLNSPSMGEKIVEILRG